MNFFIAIPCFNCEKQILRVLNSFALHFEDELDIVLIDNGSLDDTQKVIQKFCETHSHHNLSLYKNEENYGLGGTHKVAFDLAAKKEVEFFIICHGDDQAYVKDINHLIEAYEKYNCSILGSRFSQESKLVGYQKIRIWGNLALNFLFSIVLRRKIVDLGAGLNLFTLEAISKIDIKQLSDRFNFNVDLLLSFINQKIKFHYQPIQWRELDQVSNARNYQVAVSMIKSLFYWTFFPSQKSEIIKEYRTKLICSNK